MMSKERILQIKAFHIEQLVFGKSFSIKNKLLSLKNELPITDPTILKSEIRLIKPGQHNVEINTIMDVMPISSKVLGKIGEGITHTLTGVQVILTGRIKNGEQLHEFGSSDGVLSEKMIVDRAGTPKEDDWIIHIDIVAKEHQPFNRELCLTVFRLADEYIQEIRETLKMLDGRLATEIHEYKEEKHLGKPKVALVKQVAGQGAMYDMLLFPNEPSGFAGGISIIDMNNMPVLLSPNEYRDGVIRSMV